MLVVGRPPLLLDDDGAGEEELLWVLNPLCYSGIQFSLSFLPFEILPQFNSISSFGSCPFAPSFTRPVLMVGGTAAVEECKTIYYTIIEEMPLWPRRARMQRRGDELRFELIFFNFFSFRLLHSFGFLLTHPHSIPTCPAICPKTTTNRPGPAK